MISAADDLVVSNEPVLATRNAAAIITHIDERISEILGWRPEQLIGAPAAKFVHPDDQPSAVAAWISMISEPGSIRVWRGRLRAADGSWKWIETINENHLDEPEPVVRSSITLATVEQVGVEEELRARTQVLTLLSDALPVGVLQIDTSRRITFTNDRLHAIIGSAGGATIDALFAGVLPEDKPLLEAALTAVLAEKTVDDVEFRLESPSQRVCLLSLRALTDGDGVVSGAIGCLSDVTLQAQLRHELELRASVDTLTSCLNRAATIELLSATLSRQVGSGRGTAVVYIDLDRFKPVNDVHGHAAGDRVLVTAAERLRSVMRGSDQLGRLGGDEFLAICPGVESAAQAVDVAARFARVLDVKVDIGPCSIEVTASVGVAWTKADIEADTLIAQADLAMYSSKRSGSSEPTLFADAPVHP